MKRRLTGLLGAVAMSLVTVIAPPVSGSTPSRTTFADVVAGSKLVVLARIHIRPDGGVHLVIERVLKGRSGLERDYPPLLQTPPWDHWSEVVIAFREPSTDDFRAYTIAWHVAHDGTIDPEHFQRYPGLPTTLDAMLRYFGAPATSSSVGAPVGTGSSTSGLLRLILVALAGLAGLAIGLHRFARSPVTRLPRIE